MSVRWFDRETLDQTVAREIQRVGVVLDVGPGVRPQTFFRPQLHICCEPYAEYVQILRDHFGNSSDFVVLQGSWSEVLRTMPDQSVDSVFMIDLIEHLEKDEGRSLLRECERVARNQIVLFTPLGFMPQEYESGDEDGWGLHGGRWQTHRSGWAPADFDDSWHVLASKNYHTISGKGEFFDPPVGAFWAIKNVKQTFELSTKLAVVSSVLPPSPYGQAMILNRVLRDLRPEDYCLLSSEDYDPYSYLQTSLARGTLNSSPRLPARYYRLPPEPLRLQRILGRLRLEETRESLNEAQIILRRARSIARIIAREECGAILACSGDAFDLPAAYLASQWARVPFYAYLFDDYLKQWEHPAYHRPSVRRAEPLALRGAAGVIVPNEFLRDEYRRRYQVEPVIVRNASEARETEDEAPLAWPVDDGEIKVVYTGAIYHAHYDAFRNLIEAIEKIDGLDIKLHLYTAQSREELEREGIVGPVVVHKHVTPTDVSTIQRRSDILFLPLAFHSTIPEVVRTSSPGKMGEYLASGRPILTHAPADSFVSWYFREHECGVVVDKDDPAELSLALQRIAEDDGLRQEIVRRARERAQTDFSLEAARATFLKLLHARTNK